MIELSRSGNLSYLRGKGMCKQPLCTDIDNMVMPTVIFLLTMDAGSLFHPNGQSGGDACPRRDNTKSRTCLNTFETYTISTDLNFIKNLNGFLQNSKEEVVRIVENKSKEKKGIKWYVCAKVRFVRKTAETEEEKCESHFRSICEISLLNESPEKKKSNRSFLKILSSCEEFEGRGSGWILDEILHLEVKTCAYQPLAPSSYIPLPKTITKKKL
ncbi:uncharacterized protein TNCV_3306631 [Trichonephila clavipes]|nr:uncharacterized protein TNCV_3306631 [Trichonephila clavipes]